jgi:hypothetical protein
MQAIAEASLLLSQRSRFSERLYLLFCIEPFRIFHRFRLICLRGMSASENHLNSRVASIPDIAARCQVWRRSYRRRGAISLSFTALSCALFTFGIGRLEPDLSVDLVVTLSVKRR